MTMQMTMAKEKERIKLRTKAGQRGPHFLVAGGVKIIKQRAKDGSFFLLFVFFLAICGSDHQS
jgi:hypothetical protein